MDKHMMQYALQLAQSGFAVLPTKPGTKRPIANWAEYQTKAPTSGQLKIWYMNGATTSLGIITGNHNIGYAKGEKHIVTGKQIGRAHV